MKSLFKTILIFTIFLCIGELITRVDGIYEPFKNGANEVKLKADIKETEEYKLINSNNFEIHENDFRVMTLGDSFIHGGGIDFRNNTSQQLKILIEEAHSNCGTSYMLDLSRPGNNTLDNFNTFKQFFEIFQPNVVLLGYTLRDVLGPMDKTKTQVIRKVRNDDDIEIVKKKTVDKGIYKIINPFRRNSYLFRYLNNSIQRALKIRGIVIPNLGSFHYATHGAYSEKNENWMKSKALMKEMGEICTENKSLFVTYYFPEFNVLEHPKLFEKVNPSINSFFKSEPSIVYFNGLEGDFSNATSDEYFISKYDAHPNEKAHKMIATTVFNSIKSHKLLCNK